MHVCVRVCKVHAQQAAARALLPARRPGGCGAMLLHHLAAAGTRALLGQAELGEPAPGHPPLSRPFWPCPQGPGSWDPCFGLRWFCCHAVHLCQPLPGCCPAEGPGAKRRLCLVCDTSRALGCQPHAPGRSNAAPPDTVLHSRPAAFPAQGLPPCCGHLPGNAGVASSKPGLGMVGLAAASQTLAQLPHCRVRGLGRLVSLLLQALWLLPPCSLWSSLAPRGDLDAFGIDIGKG